MAEPVEAGRISYRPGEAAAVVGVSQAFIYKLMEAGALPTVRLGRCRLILHRDLEALLESHRCESWAVAG